MGRDISLSSNQPLQATLDFAFLFFLDPQPSAPDFFRWTVSL